MKKYIIVLLFIPLFVFAQNEGNIWYFGHGAGLDFNSGSPVPLNDGMLNTLEGCATISDDNGDLLFYTDGITVYDKLHNIMPNGTGLLGHYSSTQSAMIVKKPQASNIYYIFTVDTYISSSGDSLCYSEVDMTLNGGLGGVTDVKNVLLFQYAAEKVTAVPHCNGVDFWIVAPQHIDKLYYSYLLTPTGINPTPVQSSAGNFIKSGGYLSTSPDGTKIAACYRNGDYVDIMSFDNTTGILSYDFSLNGILHAYGASFSPNSKVLYLSSENGVYQCDLMFGTNEDIINSLLLIDENSNNAALQLGPDGKIYHANSGINFGPTLSVIENPNTVGLACNYMSNTVTFAEGTYVKYGLPNFFGSMFSYLEPISSSNFCLGDSTHFEISDCVDSVVWNFDDTPSGESNTSLLNNPCHVFSFPGIYNVEALIYNGGASSIYFESITVTEPVLAIMSGGDSVCIGELFMDAQIIASGIGPFNVDYSNGFSNFTLIGESPFDINIIQGGVYTITSILGANNCQGVVMGEATYVTISYPTADFHIESNEIFIDETDIIFENYSLDNSSSNWSFGDGYFSQDNAPFINHIYNDVETYHIELIVQNEFGCADTTAQSLIVKPIQYFLPNAFTPNDQNNINDSFGLLSDKVQSFDMMIFDRWGVMVYETDEIVSPWDGTVNGVDAQSGVYNYKILVEDPLGIIHKLSGSVSLIK